MVGLIEQSRMAVDELIDVAGRATIERLANVDRFTAEREGVWRFHRNRLLLKVVRRMLSSDNQTHG
jgi:hypothetical protein